MRFSRKIEEWIPMFCSTCQVDVDVPRVEWIVSGTLYCEECASRLEERSQENVPCPYDTLEEYHDYADKFERLFEEYEHD